MSQKRQTSDDVKVKAIKKASREIWSKMPRSKFFKVKDRKPSRREKTRDFLEEHMSPEGTEEG